MLEVRDCYPSVGDLRQIGVLRDPFSRFRGQLCNEERGPSNRQRASFVDPLSYEKCFDPFLERMQPLFLAQTIMRL
jgi:hypothetical protein